MKINYSLVLGLSLTWSGILLSVAEQQVAPNPRIDYSGFLKDAAKVGQLRERRRLSEDQFIHMSAEPNTVIYDARSKDKYELLHIAGAKHLSLTDVTAEELTKIIPNKTTRILIYCNNNFFNEPEAFASKAQRASLNIYTFNTLYSYGYTNVYELGPFLDITKSKIPFQGSKTK